MKIRSLTFLSNNELQKYRTIADNDVVEFIESINDKIDNNIKVNKPLKALYDTIIDNWSLIAQSRDVPSEPPIRQSMLDSVRVSLQEVPVDELRFYYPSETYIIDNLKEGGIDNLGQLYGSKSQDLMKLRHIGSAALSKIESMKEAISQNPNVYIDSWRNGAFIRELPSNYDRSIGLSMNLRNAFLELADIIEKKLDNLRYVDSSQQRKSYSLLSTILKKKYGEGKGDIQISDEENYSSERIRQVRTDCVDKICSGKIFFNNYRLNQGLSDLLASLKEECMYAPISKFESYSGTSETDFLVDLGCDVVDVKDTSFIIPTDTKGIYKNVGQVIVKILVENPLPTDKDVLYELVVNSEELSENNYDPIFVKNVLSCNDIVDIMDDNLIQIKNEHLTHAGQRYARIIYEAGTKITTTEAKKRYKEIYKVIPATGPTNSGTYGISCEGRRYWYYGEPKVPLQQKVTEFAEDRKIFYYKDVELAISNEGFTIPQAFRVYITNICVVDNKDKNHFCHKDYVDDYPNYSWRNPTKYGWANWVYNEIKNILNEKGELPIQEMIDELEKRSHATDYSYVRQRLQYNNMEDYCGEDKPFIIKDGNVHINPVIYEATDFEIIALRGKYAYYKQIRSLVANEVHKAESGKIKMMDIIHLVNDAIVDDTPLSRNTIIKAIKDEQHRFSPIDVDIINENGILYVQWTKQEIIPEPVYTANPSDDGTGDNRVVEVETTEIRPSVQYRQIVNLHELNDKLISELSFARGWMFYEHYDYEKAIATFIDFINHSQNPNISQRLPQDLYEYWFASTDENDRYRYLTDLLIFFEGLLAELYTCRYGTKPHTHGLSELATNFDGLPDLLLYSRDDRGFSRIASNLQYNRNKVAHGVYIEMNSRDTANRIVDYVALFVYVVARYYNNPQE